MNGVPERLEVAGRELSCLGAEITWIRHDRPEGS
jgi:hypothetical protein